VAGCVFVAGAGVGYSAALLVTGVAIGGLSLSAIDLWMRPLEPGEAHGPPLSDRCFLMSILLRHPAQSQMHTVDYNTYNRARIGSSCTTATTLYPRPAGFLAVRGSFVKASGSSPGVCRSFNFVENNAETADFGIGAPVTNPSADCNGPGNFYAAGQAWRIINGNKTFSDNFATNNHYFP
jgi:hypothetical protein